MWDIVGSNAGIWIGFNLLVVLLLVVDLGVFHRNAHEVKVREALRLSVFWIALALLFNAFIWYWRGPEVGLQWFTGYLIEKSLSVDNLFVFLVIFSYFAVPAKYQHKVLFWGILGALVMRGLFITIGAALLNTFDWIIYIFGAFLVFTGFRMMRGGDEEIHPERNPIVNFVRRLIPVTPSYESGRFFTRIDGRRLATPLLIVLVMVETTDLVFAVDSIPAIFAVTRDPFLVFASNVFAILGLRSLYFLLAGVVHRFHLLKYGLSFILVFVGTKMLIVDFFKVPVVLSLAVIAVTITASVVLSLLFPRKEEKK